MHVSFGSGEPAGKALARGKIGAHNFIISSDSKVLVIRQGSLTVVLEGEFYYYATDSAAPTKLVAAGLQQALERLVTNHGPEELPTRLEGSYVGAWFDDVKERAGLFADALNRRALYLVKRADGLFATTDLESAVDAAGARRQFDQNSLYSYFVLGYPSARDTFYKGVARLGPDEFMRISPNGAERKVVRAVRQIEEFGRDMLDEYDRRISLAVSSRASASGNVVMNSGGWDSTALIYLLTKDHAPESIRSVVFDVILPDGQSFNVYEVDKAKRIADFFGISCDRAVIDYQDRTLLDFWEQAVPELRAKHVYFWLHHLKIGDAIAGGSSADTGVFNGEASDSIHNFGFSQFVSVNYDNMLLREYADKAKTYLYGPTFFAALDAGSYRDDKVLSFFHNYYGKERFESDAGASARELRERYFEAFMLSYPRVPFARWQNSSVAKKGLQSSFSTALRTGPMKSPVDEATPDTLYYWLLQLYREFHFQSYQIGINHVAMGRHGMSCQLPFLDARMLDYMYRMPENWGRGLELRTTKYPLRYLAAERWRMPINIMEEAGPHSYIAENDRRWTYAGGSWSIYCEIMFRSVFADYFKERLMNQNLEELLDPAMFDVTAIQAVVRNYVEGKENPADVGLLFKLAVLVTIGLYS